MDTSAETIKALIDLIARRARLRSPANSGDATAALAAYLYEQGYPVKIEKRWMGHKISPSDDRFIQTPLTAILVGHEETPVDLWMNEGWEAIWRHRKADLLAISPKASIEHSLMPNAKRFEGDEVLSFFMIRQDWERSKAKIQAIEHQVQAFLLSKETPATLGGVRRVRL